MKLFKFNSRKILVLILTLVVSLMMVGCGNKKEILAEINEAINSITLGDVTTLKESFDIRNTTNVGEFSIKWELVDADATLKLENKNETWTKVVVTPTAYTEDANGKQTNAWGKGTLKATVEKEDQSVSRTWDLHVVPGVKTTVLTVAGIKTIKDDSSVEITGIVRYVVDGKGLYVEDNTGGIYVFLNAAPAEGVVAGAEVTVKGKKVLYYGMPQITGPTVTVVNAAPTAGYDYTKAPAMEIADINAATTADLDVFGKLVKITGMVVKDYKSPTNGDVVSQFAIKDTITNETAAIYNSSSQAVKDALAAKVGKYVSIVVVVNDFHSSQKVWRLYGVDGTIKDAEAPTLTDTEIVASAKAQVEVQLKDKSFASNLTLPAAGLAGGTITWASSNTAVVANDGKVTLPAVDTDVELTFTIKSGAVEEEYKLTVKILAVTKMTVKQAIDALDVKDQMVMIEGVIVGADSDGYYYLADETGVVFVRNKLTADNLVVGNKVRVVATGTVYNRTSEYTRQVGPNYTVTKLDNDIHESPLAAVKADLADFDYTITKDNMGTKVPEELLYGKIVTFEAYVVKRTSGTYTDPYIAVSTEDNATAMIIHHKSVDRSSLDAYVGKKITITGVVYSFNGNTLWRFGFMNRVGDVVAEFTETEKLAIAKEEIEAVVTNDKAVTANLGFFTDAKSSTISTAKYVWSSNNTAVIANDGKFTAPTADTDVVITVKVFLDGNVEGTASATHTYTVKAKAPVSGELTLSHEFGFGDSGVAGYNDGTDTDFKVTNKVDNSEFTLKFNTVQTATSPTYDPHKEAGAFAVMAINRNKAGVPFGTSYIELDLTGQNIKKIEFDYSWWSPADADNKALIDVLAFQVWNQETSTWDTLKDLKADIDATKYLTLSKEITSGTKFRIYGTVVAGTAATKNVRVTIDNIKLYK